jgi:hypothetical protein
MHTRKRTTLYLEPELHKAPRRRAVADDRSISDAVTKKLDAVLAELQSATLTRHADH